MEKLNEYLQLLMSTCSEELHLEPDVRPYLVSGNKRTDVSNTPVLGTHISMMVFPLIPPDVKAALPSSSEIEFVHQHNAGNFGFYVQKSPAGFNVTIRPMLSDARPSPPDADPPEDLLAVNTDSAPVPPVQSETIATPPSGADLFTLESPSAGREYEPEFEPISMYPEVLIPESSPAEAVEASLPTGPPIELVPVNDPEFATVFSPTSAYEPPGDRIDADTDYSLGAVAEPEELIPSSEPLSAVPPPRPVEPAPPAKPPKAEFVAAVPNGHLQNRMDMLFQKMSELGASDLHMSVSMPPMVRKDGKMAVLESDEPVLTAESMEEMLTSIMPAKNQEEFAERRDTDFAYEIPGLARFRCNIFMDRKGMGAVFRIIPTKILTAEQLGLSKAIMDLCTLSKGLVVVTGPTGSGKSTTLCAMVDSINKNREEHIITIEDPIEFVHENQKCLVNQREVHNHTNGFKQALRAALREDPDIVLVGEMRDLETISIAIETAETGHLVFGTLHTTTAASTVDRIIDQFPADRQQQIRVMLSESLKGVIAQTLLPKKGGGRVAALEVLIVTPAISNLIREGKTFQIPSAMQTGKSLGMVMLNDALYEHVENGTVEPADAYQKAVDKPAFESMLTKGGFTL